MKTAISLWIVVSALAATTSAQRRHSCPNGPHTLYSQNAVTLDGAMKQPVRVSSPDGQKVVRVKTVMDDPTTPDGWRIDLTVKSAEKTFTTSLPGFNGELAWSPDSKAFAVTLTTGGGSLGSRVYVFFVEPTGLRKVDVSAPIERHFGHPVQCEVEIAPNTGFIGWQADSSTLLVAAEVVPVSICHCMGAYRVYAMKLPSATIAGTMTQAQAKKQLWPSLGCELRDADDSCDSVLRRHDRPLQPSKPSSENH